MNQERRQVRPPNVAVNGPMSATRRSMPLEPVPVARDANLMTPTCRLLWTDGRPLELHP